MKWLRESGAKTLLRCERRGSREAEEKMKIRDRSSYEDSRGGMYMYLCICQIQRLCVHVCKSIPKSLKQFLFVIKGTGDERFSSSTSISRRVAVHATLCSVAEYWKVLQKNL